MTITAYCDGSCYNSPGKNTMGLGVYLQQSFEDERKMELKLSAYAGLGTNNIAEYMAVILAMSRIKYLTSLTDNSCSIIIYSDSELVISQITGKYRVNEKLAMYYKAVKELEKDFPNITYAWNRRDTPSQQIADTLSKLGNPYFNEDYVATGVEELLPAEVKILLVGAFLVRPAKGVRPSLPVFDDLSYLRKYTPEQIEKMWGDTKPNYENPKD